MFLARRTLYFISSGKCNQYYKVLDVTPTATDKEIKAQFHKLAKQYHPDSGKYRDANKFKEILEAYKYLSDPANRKEDSTDSYKSNTSTSE
jgi:DnaJ-class molecular chaperone